VCDPVFRFAAVFMANVVLLDLVVAPYSKYHAHRRTVAAGSSLPACPCIWNICSNPLSFFPSGPSSCVSLNLCTFGGPLLRLLHTGLTPKPRLRVACSRFLASATPSMESLTYGFSAVIYPSGE
jgi:hypothetical protein